MIDMLAMKFSGNENTTIYIIQYCNFKQIFTQIEKGLGTLGGGGLGHVNLVKFNSKLTLSLILKNCHLFLYCLLTW